MTPALILALTALGLLVAVIARRRRVERTSEVTLKALAPVLAALARQAVARDRREFLSAVAHAAMWQSRLAHRRWQRDAEDSFQFPAATGTYERHLASRTRQSCSTEDPHEAASPVPVRCLPAAGGVSEAVDAREHRTTDASDAATIGGVGALGGGWHLYDWYRLDERVAEAASRYANVEINNNSDLWAEAQDWSGAEGVIVGLRGHIGEQEAARLLAQADFDVELAAGGSNPGWDLDAEGVHANVKVVADASALSKHFDKYPDIPVIVNGDAANLPADAIRFDPQTGLDPDVLIGEDKILILEGLTLRGTEDLAREAVAAAQDGPTDAAEGLPGLALLTSAVASSYREGRLLRNGDTDWARAARNVGVDVVTRGGGSLLGGMAAGAAAGAGKGLLVDAGAGGATLGLAAVGMGIAGAVAGARAGGKIGNSIKMKELRVAQKEASDAFEEYSRRTQTVHEDVATRVRRAERTSQAELHAALKELHAGRWRDLVSTRQALADAHRFDAHDLLAQVDASLLTDIEQRRSRLAGSYTGPQAYLDRASTRAVANWRRQARRAAAYAGRGDAAADALFWDQVCAIPTVADKLSEHLDHVQVRRDAVLAELIGRSVVRGVAARQQREHAQLQVHLAHDKHVREGRARLATHGRQLKRAHAALRSECRKAGITDS